MTRLRRAFRWLLPRATLVGVGILLAVGMIEVYARVTHLGSGGFWEPDRRFGWRNIPGVRGWESCFGECETRVEISSRGLHDREIPYEKAAGARRVLLLGDSMTAALQVPLDATFAKVAEAALRQTEPGVEVINTGTNGFGTDNELIYYREEGRRYDPDVVVLAMYLANDIYNNSRELELLFGGQGHKPYFTLDDGGALVLRNFPVAESGGLGTAVGTFLKRNFQSPRFLAQVLKLREGVPAFLQPLLAATGGGRAPETSAGTTSGATVSTAAVAKQADQPSDDVCAAVYSVKLEEAWAITRKLITTLRNEAAQDGAELVVAVLPAGPQLTPQVDPATGAETWYCDRPNEELESFLKAEGIPTIDLLDPMREAARSGERYHFTRDFHMNEAGNRLVGQILAERLQPIMDRMAQR